MQEFVLEEACAVGTVMCESAGEYTLPDYMQEVRRVLRVDADACITGQYESGDKTAVGGETRYTLLYCDGEGHLAAAGLDGTFEGMLNMPAGAPLMVYPKVNNVACRLSGPRRVSVRAGVSLHTDACTPVTVGVPEVAGDAGHVETLTRPMRVSRTAYFHASDLALTDSVKVVPDASVLSTDGQVLVREVKCEEGQVRVRGEAWLTALLAGEGHQPFVVSCKIPFEETVTCDGAEPGFAGIARGCCRHISAETGEGTGGWSAIFDVTLDLDGMVMNNRTCDAVVDLYSTSCPITTESRHVTGRNCVVAQMANFTVDGTVTRDSLGGGEDVLRPIDARATVGTITCTTEGAVVVVEGEMRVACILACDITDGGYKSETFTIPYKVRVNCGEVIPAGVDLVCDVTCVSCRARADGERLGVDAEIGVMVVGYTHADAEIITGAACDPDAPFAHDEDEIIAAYLADGDSLWSIGKRYHTPLAEIVRANSLPDEVLETPDFPPHLDGISRLII